MQEIILAVRTPIDIDDPFRCECQGYSTSTHHQVCDKFADCMVYDVADGKVVNEDAHWHANHEHVVKPWRNAHHV